MALFRKRVKGPSTTGILPNLGYWIEWIAWGAKMLVWIVECLRNMPERPHLPEETIQDGEE